MAVRGARREDTSQLRARVMELFQVMSLLYVLLLVIIMLEQLLVKEVLKVVKEVEEVEAPFLSSLSLSTTTHRTPP